MKLLHLSDLHFGYDKEEEQIARRSNYLEEFQNKIINVRRELGGIEYVIISGDIGWRGIATDYMEAKAFIVELVKNLELGMDCFFLCSGNHDVCRDLLINRKYPNNQKKQTRC